MKLPLFDRHPRADLSAYVDNELPSKRVDAVKAHLSSCPTCRADLDALRNLKSQLAAVPESPAPRSFALTPRMAQRPAPEPARVRTPSRVAEFSNGMRLAGAGMAVALAVVMVLNFSGSSSDGDNSGARTSALNVPVASNAKASAQYDSAGRLQGEDAAPTNGADASGSGDNSVSTATPPVTTSIEATPGAAGAAAPADGLPSSPEQAPVSSEPAPPDSNPPEKSLGGLDGASATLSAAARDLATDQTFEALPATGPESDGGGVDILLLATIALAAGVVLAFAGSLILPRIARDDR